MTPALADLVRRFQELLHLPDPAPLLVTLGAYVANRLPGDPVWLLLVGPPSSGKTEILQALVGSPLVHPVSTITEAGLLSGTSRKERAESADGGLLRRIGLQGIILAKDFTSVLSMHREARSALMAALREIFDGHWIRRLGTDGGLSLEWRGKAGFLGGCTETIDRHHQVMASMGERFALFRMPALDETETALKALEIDDGAPLRRELSVAVHSFLQTVELKVSRPDAVALQRLAALGE